jgi:hypothetical protein
VFGSCDKYFHFDIQFLRKHDERRKVRGGCIFEIELCPHL